MDYLRNGKIPLIAAHRGMSAGNIPCNSEAAYKAAVHYGADIVEIDVSISLDQKLFVFHPFMEHAHLDLPMPIMFLTAKQVKRRRYVNQDNAKTDEKVLTLDDALEILKGKCIVNVDKFWTAPGKISECIRRHNMAEQVIIKSPPAEKNIKAIEELAADMPYMAMIKENDSISEMLSKRNINYIGIEAIFKDENAQVVSQEHIEQLHKNGLAVWGNAIIYNRKDVISAGHTDDVAVTGDADFGWGWFYDKGFDIVQTDWLPAIKQYYSNIKIKKNNP